MRKRILVVAAMAVAVFALSVAPAMAEGYNNGQWNFTTGADEAGYADNAGIYVRDNADLTADQIATDKGPHGDYTVSTNKCQDCHSTHYATGSYMLLRANSREAACDFCHSGGGGSNINIMMDNTYATKAAFDAGAAAANDMEGLTSALNNGAEGMGLGTGHTLGYTGKAPADVDPAYENAEGLACFSCHSPHGNSARIMGTFGSPSAVAGPGDVDTINLSFYLFPTMASMTDLGAAMAGMPAANVAGMFNSLLQPMAQVPLPATSPMAVAWDAAGNNDGELNIDEVPMGTGPVYDSGIDPTLFGMPASLTETDLGFPEMGNIVFNPVNIFSWGIDNVQGNICNKFNFAAYGGFSSIGVGLPTSFANAAAAGVGFTETWKKPLWPAGKFLLLKNPDNEDGAGKAGDMDVTAGSPNKIQTNWDNPLGPAASWGDFYYTQNNEKFPLMFPFSVNGIAMENEFCADCHDGAAGDSEQAASVWLPGPGAANGQYITAYSHDSNTRGCARQQYLDPADGNNFGPHCANCHTGAGNCNVCHSAGGTGWEGTTAFDSTPALMTEWTSAYEFKTKTKASAVAGINAQCVDGGFSFPHRTLGANMLKDSIYGVDYDGTPVAVGDTRGVGATNTNITTNAAWIADMTTYSAAGASAPLAVAENLDSVCIDCHGAATVWNGDNSAYYTSHYVSNPLAVLAVLNPAIQQGWTISGWELTLKGLP